MVRAALYNHGYDLVIAPRFYTNRESATQLANRSTAGQTGKWEPMGDRGLLVRLNAIRRTIRRRLLGYGLCAVLAGGVASFLTVVTLDWLLWFPAALRLFVALLFFAGFALAAWYWIVVPMRTKVTVEQIAGRLECHFDQLRDRLSSSVQFLQRNEDGISPLAARVVTQTEALVAETALESALTPRPLFFTGLTLTAAAAALALVLLVAPHWVQTGWQRYTAPLAPLEWPRTVDIEPLTENLTVAVGESATVRMRVRRGLSDTLRGVLRLADQGGDIVPLVMQRGTDGEFHAGVDAITRDLVYWFEAGDATTESAPFRIRAVHRPEMLECLAIVDPPAYALHRLARTHDLKEGPVRAPMGGMATIAVRSSKPLWTNTAQVRNALRMGDGSAEPLEASDPDRQRAALRLPVTRDLEFRIEITDEEGFENRGGTAFSLLAVPDRPPSPSILDPQTLVEMTPQASLRVVGRVEDDHGLSRVELILERPADGSMTATALEPLPSQPDRTEWWRPQSMPCGMRKR